MSNRERIARAAEEARAAAVEKAQKKAEKLASSNRAASNPSVGIASSKAPSSKAPTSKTTLSKTSSTPKAEAAKPRAKRVAKPTRMKIVWEICSGNGEVVKTYPYAEKAAAEAELLRLSNTKREHVLRNTKVPME